MNNTDIANGITLILTRIASLDERLKNIEDLLKEKKVIKAKT